MSSLVFIHARRIACLALVCVLTANAAVSALAQSSMACHDMGAMKDISPPEQLPPPVKMTGLGNSHLAIKATAEAQIWFDQGLNEYHDFWDYEADRSFEQAIRIDPTCAMCYWGLYRALSFRGQQDAYARQALDNAVRLKPHAGKEDKLYIAASVAEEEAQQNATKDKPDMSSTIAIRRQIVKKYPGDIQAKIFLAGALMDGFEDGEPKDGTRQAIVLLEEVLKQTPNDSAANHYWIHAMEPSNHPERAIPSSALLASLSPASGHMVHMPGHIYYRTGDYAAAEHWFASSTAVDEAYMKAQNIDVDDDWNYVHNLMYAIANLLEEGKLIEATTLSAKLSGARGQLAPTLYVNVPRDAASRIDVHLPVALRTGDWVGIQKMLDASHPDARLENLLFLAGQLRSFAAGMQAVDEGRIADAEQASNQLDAALWRMSDKESGSTKPQDLDSKQSEKKPDTKPVQMDILPDAKIKPLLTSLSIMSLELRASILAAEKKLPEAIALFDKAAKQEQELGYREPPTYIRPVGETEGLALLNAGDAIGAHKAYEAALRERPNSGLSLYGMARSSEAANDSAKARAEYNRFLEAWKNGDTSAPQFQHAQQYLNGQKTTASAI